ncbi:hypothetical protein BGZ79_000688, partial [Entomortierella chlamydospora]
MKTVSPRPLEIPEILLSIADYLEQRHVVKCLKVCRSWNELLKPLIWESVTIGYNHGMISPEGPAHDCFIAHSHHVTDLEIVPPSNLEQYTTFPNLHTLKIHYNRYEYKSLELYQIDMARFIALNPSLVYLSLGLNYVIDTDKQLWEAVSSLPRLRRLRVFGVGLVEDELDAFWEVFSKLEFADLVRVRFPVLGLQLAERSFPRIRKLSISLARIKELEIIFRCMNLQELEWDTYENNSIHYTFANDIERGLAPKLERLRIRCTSPRLIFDEDLERIIGCMQQIKSLSLDQTEFGLLSFRALRRHFSTLADLDLYFNGSVTSAMNQELLCSYPLLEKFQSKYISAKDVVEGGEWVCLSLKILKLVFMFDKSEQDLQPLIFRRLSSLVLIESFDTSDAWRYRHYGGGANRTLDMRLASGLDQLSGWKKIEYLTFTGSGQSMEEVDIRW